MKYDSIILGAGSAGCVLAARLSENPRRSVLLLEAGPDYPTLGHLPDDLKGGPNLVAASEVDASHNWSFVGTATPQQGRRMPVPRGKVVGGSSAINAAIFHRGLPEDYDRWVSLGNEEWSYHGVLPYLRKVETDLDIQDDFHGSNGPVPVHRYKPEKWHPIHSAFYEACRSAGFPHDPDMNNPETTGVGHFPMNNPGDVRMSTALTHLNLSRHKLNLTIKAGVLARRIMFDGRRAIAVEVDSAGERFVAEGEEIILSAGAIASPQLLMLSGVGQADHLRSLGIQVVHDMPGVGQNLRDHPMVELLLQGKEGSPVASIGPSIQVALRYTADGSALRNDMHLMSFAPPEGPSALPAETHAIHLGCTLKLAVGAGELKLSSADPYMQPQLDYRFLADPWDRQRLREAVRLAVQLLEQRALRDILADRLMPTDRDLKSDEALDAWMLENVSTTHHISGTSKMGPASDPMAVVDQYCRVHRLEGLRVVDASVMPDVPRAATNATTVMIAERVADWIT